MYGKFFSVSYAPKLALDINEAAPPTSQYEVANSAFRRINLTERERCVPNRLNIDAYLFSLFLYDLLRPAKQVPDLYSAVIYESLKPVAYW